VEFLTCIQAFYQDGVVLLQLLIPSSMETEKQEYPSWKYDLHSEYNLSPVCVNKTRLWQQHVAHRRRHSLKSGTANCRRLGPSGVQGRSSTMGSVGVGQSPPEA